MSAVPRSPFTVIRAAAAPAAAPGPSLSLAAKLSQKSRWVAVWVSSIGLPRLVWWLGRSGRPGFAGMALFATTAVFLFSTHLPLTNDLVRLRGELADARAHEAAARRTPNAANAPARDLRNLPARTEMPRLLGILFQQADDAHLAIDTAKYEMSVTKAGALVRYRLSFPVNGPYPSVRQFIDSSLIALPNLAIDELTIARKAIGDPSVEAQLRVTIFTRSGS